MRVPFKFFALFLCGILLVALPETSSGQDNTVTLPDGTSITTDGYNGFTSTTFYRNEGETYNPNWKSAWSPPKGRRIIDVHEKGTDGTVLILLDDGSIYEYSTIYVIFGAVKFRSKIVAATFSEGFNKLVGDDLYTLSSSFVYVSHDTAKTWSLDSAGLGSAHVWDVAVDSAQNVYAATDKGLFVQALKSNTWGKVNSFTLSTNLFKIFIDRKNRFYLAGNGGGTFMSTNDGSTWSLDTSGIGNLSFNAFGDDAFGNIYSTSSGSGNTPGALYKSPGGTSAWARIDQGILSITVKAPGFNSIGGDTSIFAGTTFGLFFSTNQGTTWSVVSSHIRAEVVSGFVKGQGGRYFVATGLGIFRKDPADTSWTKTYPVNGYNANIGVARDGLGNIYALSGTTTNGGPIVYISTDNGTSWNPDTAGLSQLRSGVFAINEIGGQHLATSQYGSSFTTMVFRKPFGGSWVPDTAGFKSTNLSFTSALASDNHSTLYASGSYFSGSTRVNGKVVRKLLPTGTWIADTTGIPSSINYFNTLLPDKDGNMIGITGASIVRHSGGVWSSVTGPTIAGSIVNSVRISVDSSGALFAATFGSDVHFVSRGLGVWFSTDAGTTWKFAGGDSISFTGLISYGDTTYGYSPNGLFAFTRKVAAGVTAAASQMPSQFILEQNYPNPFNPLTHLRFTIADFPPKADAPSAQRFVRLKIFDVLGREVATLVNEQKSPGNYDISWSADRYSSGVYFYQLRAGGFVETKKMVLMK